MLHALARGGETGLEGRYQDFAKEAMGMYAAPESDGGVGCARAELVDHKPLTLGP